MVMRLITMRLGWGLLSLLAISLLISGGVELLPGDLATELLGQSATPAAVEALRHQLGLDVSWYIRFFHWLSGILTGDFGNSLATQRPIAELIGTRLSNTIFLALSAGLIAVPVALLLGVVTALYRNSLLDRAINCVALASISLPDFFIAYVLVMYLAVQAGWFPALSGVSPDMPIGERLYRTALPVLTLTVIVIAHMMRMTRTAIVGVLSSSYIETALLKGVRSWNIITQHALPNAWAPIVNVIAINLAYLITGVVVIEVVFVYPGLGQLLVDSVQKRDIPVVQACTLVFAGAYILLNALSDVLSILSNPRLMHPR